jgi:hypothetical protein
VNAVSEAVYGYAKRHDLEAEALHQDEPVWYVYSERRIGRSLFKRFVQIAFFENPRIDPPLEIRAIPGAQLVNEKEHLGANYDKRQDSVVVRVENGGPTGDTIETMIDKAWSSADAIKDSDVPWDSAQPVPPRA